jgi:hypothetical protein
MLDLCDSNKRWQNYNRLRKCHSKLSGTKRVGDYETEILTPRNFLAHGRPEPHESGGYLFHYRGKEFYFDDDKSLELRQTILRYKNAFSEVLMTLNDGQ